MNHEITINQTAIANEDSSEYEVVCTCGYTCTATNGKFATALARRHESIMVTHKFAS